MASFTDQPYKFNPYISTQPVDAMVKVGMYKQEQYDTNVQKIQSWIDSTAALPVSRDVDKQYLQSALNSAGEEINKLGNADFAEQQLTNSIGGMVGKISKDPNVLAAVQSTTRHQKEYEYMEEARKKGNLTPQNEFHYQKKWGEYLNSTELGRSFNGKYVDYFDVFKFAKETFDAVKPDNFSFDQVYVTGPDGKPVTDKKGNPVFSPVMVRLEKEGIFPEKVRQTLAEIFNDPRVSTQLQIDGEFSYRGYTPDILSASVDNKKQGALASLNNQLLELQLKKSAGQNVDMQIDSVNSAIKSVTASYDSLKQAALENPDYVRGLIYKDELKDKYTTMFTSVKQKEMYMDNPGWKANFEMMKEANDVAMKRADLSLKERQFAWDQKMDVAGLDMEFKKLAVAATKGKTGANGEPLNPALPDFMPSDMQWGAIFDRDYEKAAVNFATSVDELLFNTVLNSPSNQEKMKQYIAQGKSEAEARSILINNTAKKIDPNDKDGTAFRMRFKDKAMADFQKMPVDERKGSVNRLVESTQIAQSKFVEMQAQKAKIEEQYKMRYGGAPSVAFGDLSGNIKPMTVQIDTEGLFGTSIGKESKTMEASPEDVYDIALYSASIKSGYGGIGYDVGLREEGKKAFDRLQKRGKAMLIPYIDKKPEVTALASKIVTSKGFSQALADRNAIIQNSYNISPNLRVSLITGDTETDKKTISGLVTTLGNYKANEKNYAPDMVQNVPDMIKALNADGAKSVEIKTSKDNVTGKVVPVVHVYDAEGSLVGKAVVTPQEAMALGVDVNTIYKGDKVIDLENRMSFFKNGTTAYTGNVGEISTYLLGDAALNKYDFPAMAGAPYDVKANIIARDANLPDGSRRTIYYGYLYAQDKDGSMYVDELPGVEEVSMEAAQQKLQGITPQIVQKFITDQKTKSKKK